MQKDQSFKQKMTEKWPFEGFWVSVAQLCGPLVGKISVCRNFRSRILDQHEKAVDLMY